MSRLRRRSWSCFSSAIGSVLSYFGYEDLSFALDSGIDFFFRPSVELQMTSVGVWPGTEHPRFAGHLRALFGIRLEITNQRLWGGIESRICKLADGGEPFLLAVANTACRHIPRRDILECLTHYLVLYGFSRGQVLFYDSFLDKASRISLPALRAAASFVSADGDEVINRICELRLPARSGGPAPGSRHRLVTCTLLTPHLEHLFPTDDAVFDGAGIQALAQHISSLPARRMRRELSVLFQALRYVQYQRTYFARYIDEVKSAFASFEHELDTLAALVRRAAEDWFRIKMLAQYAAVKGDTSALPTLAVRLNEVALREDALLRDLNQIRSTLTCHTS